MELNQIPTERRTISIRKSMAILMGIMSTGCKAYPYAFNFLLIKKISNNHAKIIENSIIFAFSFEEARQTIRSRLIRRCNLFHKILYLIKKPRGIE